MIDNEIQSRMDAFRGNPQALMQRYAQSQQLLDLLALQKLKSEKEAAARQMQMQAGQGQMPTVAQQREQELMGMAKQDVAQRVGQVAQQQAKQQQENLQRAAQTGIAQAPAPNMMPAQAMASGGIVAFAGGGDTGVKTIEQLRKEYDDARASGDFQEASRLFKVIKAREQAAPRTVTVPVAEMGVTPQPQPQPQAAPEAPPGVPPGQRPAGPLPPPGGAGLGAIALPTARPGAMPPGAPQEAPAPQAAPAQQPMGIQAPLERTLTGALEASPEAAAAAEEAGYRKRVDPLYQKQLELQQQGIAQLQQRMAQQPKKDPLTEFLRGMSTQRTLGMALGAGGAGISAAQRANFDQQAALQDQLQKLREAEAGAQVTQETARYGAGKEAAKTAADARKAAMQSGTTYAVGMENAKVREEAAQLRAQQVADRALMAKMLTPAQIVSAQDKAGDNITAMLGKDIALQMKVNKGEVSRAELVHQEFIRLISLAAPELAAQMRASGPASGPAIPPPPKDAVKLMSKGN
jgi:hypothetical protein